MLFFILKQISVVSGLSMDQLNEEIDRREQYLEAIIESGIKKQSDVAEKILGYYVLQKAMKNGEKPKINDLWDVGVFNPFKIPEINDLFDFIHSGEAKETTKPKPEGGSNWDKIPLMLNQLQEEIT